MKTFSALRVPMLDRKWRKLAFLLFPATVLLVITLAIASYEIEPRQSSEIIYLGWSIALTILNLSKEKVEDEMIQAFRLQAFQTGFFWLPCGLVTLLGINYLRFGNFAPEMFSAGLVLFLLNLYVFAAFEYQKLRSNDNHVS